MNTAALLRGCPLVLAALVSSASAMAEAAAPPPPPSAPPMPEPVPIVTPPVASPAPSVGPPPAIAVEAVPSSGSHPWKPPPLAEGQHFTIDPVADGVLIAGGAAVSGLLSLILSTGEIRPSLPGPESNLLSFDRGAVTQHIDPNAGTYSTIGLGAAIGFAMVDPFLSAYRDGWDAALVDAVMYAETISLTETLTDITKIAVRRPRPIDYYNCPSTSTASTSAAACSDTDLQLSFFSGHASTVASIGATASYLAFQRGGARAVRPWVTLGTSLALTTFVSIERVRSGQHFPTDVVAGAFAGAMIGVLVPHLHRHVLEAPTVWIGVMPVPGGGGMNVGGKF